MQKSRDTLCLTCCLQCQVTLHHSVYPHINEVRTRDPDVAAIQERWRTRLLDHADSLYLSVLHMKKLTQFKPSFSINQDHR
jgi:hypothetical protein